MRSLVTSVIDHLWTELDGVIREELYRMTGRCGPDVETRRQMDDTVTALPIRLGGLGLHSHHISAPMAKTAADDLADSMLAPIVPNVNPPEKITSQTERCLEDHLARRRDLFDRLPTAERTQFTENQSTLSRLWLVTNPTHVFHRVNNWEVATGLCTRSLLPDEGRVCKPCGKQRSFLHDEHCNPAGPNATIRHNHVKVSLIRGFETLPGAQVYNEPTTGVSSRRNDIWWESQIAFASPAVQTTGER